jgi:ABC-2 type transport system permease protein
MNSTIHEARLLWRSPVSVVALLVLLMLSSLAVALGLREVAAQHDTLARLGTLQQQDLAAQVRKQLKSNNAGSTGYYTFHGTWDPPSSTAFLALGLRDASPYVMRVRALALQAQLHEGETFNPELVLAGRFDYAFVLVYLAPLFIIALLHDLVSGERRAGRLATLMALPGGGARLWLRRAGLRAILVFLVLGLPVLVGAFISGTPAAAVATVLLATVAYLAFWSGLSLFIATRRGSSAAHATASMGAWVLLTLLLPTLASAVLSRAVPVHQGVELMLAQRQAVHGAWDLPPADTMARFFRSHPEWRDTAPLPSGFHWKWYFAFQQLGDEHVSDSVAAYREGLLARQRWTERLGWLLPGVGVQAALHRQADTDLSAQLAFQDDVAAFHARLRSFLYPYLFRELPFGEADFAALPRFDAAPRPSGAPAAQLIGLVLVGALMAGLGGRAAARVRVG